jgi:hypothetical protein
MLSVFKAGTHLVRQILQDLTGTPFYEPPIVPGRVDYRDPAQLVFTTGHFYSWHLVPTPPIREKLIAAQARPVLVMRNLFDLAVSMYHHFADNIDADIGRGRNVDHHFRAMSRDEGLEAIITGMTRPDFRWPGLGPQADHMVHLFELGAAHPCHLTTFERVTEDKPREVAAMAAFLGITLSEQRLQEIVHGSAFQTMRDRAAAAGRPSHFRRGHARSHTDELSPRHVSLIREVIDRQAPALAGWIERTGFHELLAVAPP